MRFTRVHFLTRGNYSRRNGTRSVRKTFIRRATRRRIVRRYFRRIKAATFDEISSSDSIVGIGGVAATGSLGQCSEFSTHEMRRPEIPGKKNSRECASYRATISGAATQKNRSAMLASALFHDQRMVFRSTVRKKRAFDQRTSERVRRCNEQNESRRVKKIVNVSLRKNIRVIDKTR